jgi:hypothetical protein
VVVPKGAEPDLSKMPAGFQAVLAYASTQEIAAMGPGPVVVLTATVDGKRRGLRLLGFQPANVLAQAMGLKGLARKPVNRDLPFGETDDQVALAIDALVPAPTAQGK